jgi:class 3 adenylate cyclase
MKATILIVDDESANLDIISAYLARENQDYRIIQAVDGQDALEVLAEEPAIDLVLTDWNMPVMTGLELVKAIKASERLKHLPVLMQTANTTPAELKIAFDAGAVDYIKKPIESVELIARVKSALALSQEKRKTEMLLRKNEELLHKIFPKEVAQELIEREDATPRYFRQASILFADIKGFSATARKLKDEPEKLVKKLDECFEALDDIAVQYGIERIKTIGDCYMAVAGIPTETNSHAIDIVLAGLAMQAYMQKQIPTSEDAWQVRLGVHTGDLVAGVIGKVKFAYDVWGDSVNLASRMESTGEAGKVHITETTYELIQDFFECEKRAELVEAKNIGKVQTYFVLRIKPEYSADEQGFLPNEAFKTLYQERFGVSFSEK